MIYIGIDTGTHTGVAVWDSVQRAFLCIDTLPIHRAMALVNQYREGELMVIFEDARQRKWYGMDSNEKLQGAGSVKRDSSIWEDFLKDLEIPYRAIPPMKGATKLTSSYFKALTGWTGRTNEHSRDAAMMVFGL